MCTDFVTEYLNEWHLEPRPTIGMHECIAIELAAEIAKRIPCYIEGPPAPTDGWANIHIQGLGNSSITITIWSNKFTIAKFNNSLRTRKIWLEKAYDYCAWKSERLMCEPNSIEMVIECVFKETIHDNSWFYGCFDTDLRINSLCDYKKHGPATMFLGRPNYLVW